MDFIVPECWALGGGIIGAVREHWRLDGAALSFLKGMREGIPPYVKPEVMRRIVLDYLDELRCLAAAPASASVYEYVRHHLLDRDISTFISTPLGLVVMCNLLLSEEDRRKV